jgi:hypothetical protein
MKPKKPPEQRPSRWRWPAKEPPGWPKRSATKYCQSSSLEVVVRSPEIQDAEPIHSALTSEAATTSRGGIELLANNLVDPAVVARNLEAMRRAEQ